jgi:hypothetical protein
MATVVITIAGTTKSVKAGSLHISMTANGRSTASFAVISTDGSYRPAQDAEVLITEDGTRIFGGLLEEPKEKGVAGGKGIPAIVTSVSAADFNVYPERRYVNATIPAGTFKSQIEYVRANYLTAYGVTLSGSQVNGPTLPAFEFKYVRADEVLNELCTATADFGEPFSWRIDNFKVLSAFQPSTNAAPFTLTGDPILQVIGDIEVDTSYKHYANRVIVKVPSKQIIREPITFTGDGSTTTFTMPTGYTIVKPYGYVQTDSTLYETLTSTEFSGTATWEYSIAAGTLTRTAGAPANGTAITFYSDVNYSGEGIAEDAAEIALRGVKEIVKLVESVPDNTTAQAIAAGILAKSLTPSKQVKYKTHTAGILPGQSQSIVVARRNLNGTAVIADVVIRDLGKTTLERTVTAFIDGLDTNLGRGYRDVLKKWAGDITGGSAALGAATEAGTASPVFSGPSLPPRSNQWNDELNFGGHAAWLFFKEYTTAVLGLEHLPGGADNLLVGKAHRVTGAEEAESLLVAMASTVVGSIVGADAAYMTDGLDAAGEFVVAPL